MCSLYSVTKGPQAIQDLFAVKHDRAGDLPPLPAVSPDQMAPIVRVRADGERELVMARWGMPGPFDDQLVTNARNLKNAYWSPWLGKRNRCIVPATSFCEYGRSIPYGTPVWFALAEDRPLFAFAGLWTHWRGLRGPESARVDGAHEVFCFLATEANATVAPIHPKGMPVILTSPEEVDRWLSEEMPAALALQRPLPDDALRIVARGERSDGAPASA